MATLAQSGPTLGRDDRFFLSLAIAMALTIVAGFSFQLATGRSSFASPPHVHFHAVTFFGWVVLFVTQNVLVNRGTMQLHRMLGWIGAGWAVLLVLVGTYTTVVMTQAGYTPFFFLPAYFLVMNPMSVLVFAGLTGAAIGLRRRTDWHRRLMVCGTAILTAPAFGRLLPMPFLIPYAEWGPFAGVLVFVGAGMIGDLRRRGAVHAAWWWGFGTIVAMQLASGLIAHSPIGTAIYQGVTRGHPGAAVAPLEFPAPPAGPLITARGKAI